MPYMCPASITTRRSRRGESPHAILPYLRGKGGAWLSTHSCVPMYSHTPLCFSSARSEGKLLGRACPVPETTLGAETTAPMVGKGPVPRRLSTVGGNRQ